MIDKIIKIMDKIGTPMFLIAELFATLSFIKYMIAGDFLQTNVLLCLIGLMICVETILLIYDKVCNIEKHIEEQKETTENALEWIKNYESDGEN